MPKLDVVRRCERRAARACADGCNSIAGLLTDEVPSGVISSTVNICGADERATRDDDSLVAGPVKAEAANAMA